MYENIDENNDFYSDFASPQYHEKEDFRIISNLKTHLIQKYGAEAVSSDEIMPSSMPTVPLSVFSDKLSMLETIVKYLKEERKLGFAEIARLTKRSPTTISTTYRNTLVKYDGRFAAVIASEHVRAEDKGDIQIPVTVICNRDLSAFESLVLYLHYKLRLGFSAIAKLLGRDSRNVWTIHARATQKILPDKFLSDVETTLISGDTSAEDLKMLFLVREQIKTKYDINDETFGFLFDRAGVLELSFPVSILCKGVSPLRAVVMYLHDEAHLSFSDIARQLDRSLPLISSSYAQAKAELAELSGGQEQRDGHEHKPHAFGFMIPVRIISDRDYSVMESVVSYLRANFGLGTGESAAALCRSPSVAWKLWKRHDEKERKKKQKQKDSSGKYEGPERT